MVTRTYGMCPVTFSLLKAGGFLPQFPRFRSLFSVTLVTFHKAEFNEIKDLRGGGLRIEIGRRQRLRVDVQFHVIISPVAAGRCFVRGRFCEVSSSL